MNKIVKEYIRRAVPVSSEFLEKKCNFGICPATIRNEMKALTEAGYLYQPHTSSGRVPTSKGYRFFVDSLLEKDTGFIISDILEKRKAFKDEIKLAETVIKELAATSSGLAFAYLEEKDVFLTGGWNIVFKNPEFKEREFLEDFLLQFESIEEGIRDVLFEEFDICIGKEKSMKSDNLTLIISKSCLPEAYFGILGPSRMAYDKILIQLKYGRN